MKYRQVTSGERYMLARCRAQGLAQAEMARLLGRHPSTISRELKRNSLWHGEYCAEKADSRARTRRSHSRRNLQFDDQDFGLVNELLGQKWSPEQIAGRLRMEGKLPISHETIYKHVWRDKAAGGSLHKHLRCAPKRRRKRYGAYDSRGRLAGKRPISERPQLVNDRTQIGHWEGDTVMGDHASEHCVLSLVERKSGFLVLGKLANRKAETVTQRASHLIRESYADFKTLTLDNGSEFHDYKTIERNTGLTIYFATPHHAWERGTNENTNGLIRQYLPKRQSMAHVTQQQCHAIADKLNNRPRKRLGFKTPMEVLCAS